MFTVTTTTVPDNHTAWIIVHESIVTTSTFSYSDPELHV